MNKYKGRDRRPRFPRQHRPNFCGSCYEEKDDEEMKCAGRCKKCHAEYARFKYWEKKEACQEVS